MSMNRFADKILIITAPSGAGKTSVTFPGRVRLPSLPICWKNSRSWPFLSLQLPANPGKTSRMG